MNFLLPGFSFVFGTLLRVKRRATTFHKLNHLYIMLSLSVFVMYAIPSLKIRFIFHGCIHSSLIILILRVIIFYFLSEPLEKKLLTALVFWSHNSDHDAATSFTQLFAVCAPFIHTMLLMNVLCGCTYKCMEWISNVRVIPKRLNANCFCN
jgi:hypothetical protein